LPPPRAHLTRFHGIIFASNANLRAQFTPAHRGKGDKAASDDAASPVENRWREM